VTVEYKKEGGAVVPVRVHTILISTQHSPDVSNETIHKELMEHVIKPVVPEKYLDEKTIFHLNPSGVCVLGRKCRILGQGLWCSLGLSCVIFKPVRPRHTETRRPLPPPPSLLKHLVG
jgi:hypothetical protein